MRLAIGQLDFDDDVNYFVKKLMEIEPLPRIFDELYYIKEKIYILNELKTRVKGISAIHPLKTLCAIHSYAPMNGRLLVFTSYPFFTHPKSVGAACRKYRSVIIANYSLENILGIVPEESSIPKKYSIASIFVELSTGHELGHTFGLRHGSSKHRCIMRSPTLSPNFCNKCSEKLKPFYSSSIKSNKR